MILQAGTQHREKIGLEPALGFIPALFPRLIRRQEWRHRIGDQAAICLASIIQTEQQG